MNPIIMSLGQSVIHSRPGALIRTHIGILKALKDLEQLDNNIACLNKRILFCFISLLGRKVGYRSIQKRGILTAKADTRATVERQILPSLRVEFGPSVGAECVGVRAPDITTCVESTNSITDNCILRNKNG